MKIYVGNMSFDTDEEVLKYVFSKYGQVDEAIVARHSDSGRSRGFGFVVMPDECAASAAIAETNGRELEGRTIFVSEARPSNPRKHGNGKAKWGSKGNSENRHKNRHHRRGRRTDDGFGEGNWKQGRW